MNRETKIKELRIYAQYVKDLYKNAKYNWLLEQAKRREVELEVEKLTQQNYQLKADINTLKRIFKEA